MEASKDIFFIPYAGGTANSYSIFKKGILEEYRLIGLDFPGKGLHKGEKIAQNMEEVVESLCHDIIKQIDEREYSVFGHSLGAFVAYEVVCSLRKRNAKMPKKLILSGAPVYGCVQQEDFFGETDITKKDIIKLERQNGWINEKLIASRIFRNSIYKNMQSDLEIMHHYTCTPTCDNKGIETYILYGREDKYPLEEYEKWNEYFIKTATVKSMEGGHFYLMKNRNQFLKVLNEVLQEKE